MTTQEVANQLVKLCREGRNFQAIDSLYSKEITSTEAFGTDSTPRTMKGIPAIREKNQWWANAHDVLQHEIKGPFFNGPDEFTAYATVDVIFKETGQKMNFEEICWYKVKDGKILEEKLFYNIDS